METRTYLWLHPPRSLGSSSGTLSLVNVSRKHRDLVVDVVQRHKPPSFQKTLANNFISIVVGDRPALQDSRDLGRTSFQEKVLAVRD